MAAPFARDALSIICYVSLNRMYNVTTDTGVVLPLQQTEKNQSFQAQNLAVLLNMDDSEYCTYTSGYMYSVTVFIPEPR